MAVAVRLTPLTTRLVVEWNPKNPNAAIVYVLQYLLQANLDLRNSNLSWLNLIVFDFRKIYVANLKKREQKTNVLYWWICKLRSFLNRDSTVLYIAHCTVLTQPWFTPFFGDPCYPFGKISNLVKHFFCKFWEATSFCTEISLHFTKIWCRTK